MPCLAAMPPAPATAPHVLRLPRRPALPWPAPALLAWALAWAALLLGRQLAWPPIAALVLAVGAPLPLALATTGRWRRLLVVAGFPVSLVLAGGLAAWPAWAWLLMLAPLLAAYPVRAWRDAPFFPSPPDALVDLPAQLMLPPAPRLLDAGCGAGHGLRALRRAWPDARCDGVEWSWPLALLARLRCRDARVRRGDLWADDWSGHDLVYLFQRPESMPRAWAKASAEMRPGSWLVSLEFDVPGVPPDVTLDAPGARPVHAWRITADRAAQPARRSADNPPSPHAKRRGRT